MIVLWDPLNQKAIICVYISYKWITEWKNINEGKPISVGMRHKNLFFIFSEFYGLWYPSSPNRTFLLIHLMTSLWP